MNERYWHFTARVQIGCICVHGCCLCICVFKYAKAYLFSFDEPEHCLLCL